MHKFVMQTQALWKIDEYGGNSDDVTISVEAFVEGIKITIQPLGISDEPEGDPTVLMLEEQDARLLVQAIINSYPVHYMEN